MLISDLKLVIRKLKKNKTLSLISISGLTIGLVCCILAFLYIQDELKYDKHFSNTGNLYRLTISNDRSGTFHVGQPVIFFEEILQNIPEISSGTKLLNQAQILKIDNNIFNESNFFYVDSNFLQLWGWPLIIGSPDKALVAPQTLIISESKAKLLFQEFNPVGKTITINNTAEYTITGVFKDFPLHSHIRADYFASFSTIKASNPDGYNNWGWHGTTLYFNLPSASDIDLVNKKIAALWNEKSEDKSCVGDFVKSRLQPFSEIYLKSGYLTNDLGNFEYLLGFAVIAALVLIISCFNFINLYIADKSKSNTETGIKKVLGANKKIFARQVFFEISFYLIIAVILSSIISYFLLPFATGVINKDLSFSVFKNLPLLIFLLVSFIFILLISGIFPVIQMVYINVAGALKGGKFYHSKRNLKTLISGNLKNILVVGQFTIGTMLILSAIIVNKQLRLIRQHDLGFDKDQVLVINNYIGDGESRYNNLTNNLLAYPEVLSISSATNVPSGGVYNWGGAAVAADENNSTLFCGYVTVNEGFLKTIGAKIANGRDFDHNLVSDNEHIIINEALAKVLNLENPVGTRLNNFWDDKEKEIIGVVNNIEFLNIHYPNIPMAFFLKDFRFGYYYGNIIVKLQSKDLTQTMSVIQNEWNKVSPEYPMDYFFLDDQFNINYVKETQTALLINIMTVIAIVLCCMGLFGLAIFSINARIKEIGVRKVNGAMTFEILSLVNKEFITWILSANIIAIPLSSYFILKWLENFSYKTPLSWWAIILTGVISLGIALLTVSFQSFKAARRNPVEALKYE